jgi:RNA polymerase sigma-70 factor (ECF subfamily)
MRRRRHQDGGEGDRDGDQDSGKAASGSESEARKPQQVDRASFGVRVGKTCGDPAAYETRTRCLRSETGRLQRRMPSVPIVSSTRLAPSGGAGYLDGFWRESPSAFDLRVTPYRALWRDTTWAVSELDRSRSPGLDAAASAASEAMERYAGGDDTAFELVYDALAPRLYAFVLRRTQGNRARSEDLVQQTFLQMHHARGRFTPGADVVPWAYSIARRLLIDSVRRGTREVMSDDSTFEREIAPLAAADDLIVAKEMIVIVEAELARMPPAQREAFELVKSEGMSMAEAAEVLGTTVTAVKLRAHRAYEAIRAVLSSAARPVTSRPPGARASEAPADHDPGAPDPTPARGRKAGAR